MFYLYSYTTVSTTEDAFPQENLSMVAPQCKKKKKDEGGSDIKWHLVATSWS